MEKVVLALDHIIFANVFSSSFNYSHGYTAKISGVDDTSNFIFNSPATFLIPDNRPSFVLGTYPLAPRAVTPHPTQPTSQLVATSVRQLN